jgi:menaquinol-cytochrome c reductase iron-sulfur subunit
MLQDPSKPQTRRSFYATLVHLLGGAAAAVIAVPAAVYLLFKPKSQAAGTMVEVANLADLEAGVPKEIVYHRTRLDGWKATKEKTTTWVVKNGPQSAVAFSPACPHLGCIYHWEDQQGIFLCPCHDSAFGLDGRVLAGPAPRPLDRYASRVEGGKLLIGLQVKRS